MNVNFQASKVHLQHSKVHRMFPNNTTSSQLALIHASSRYTMHTKNFYFYIKTIFYDKYNFTANVRDHKIIKIHYGINNQIIRTFKGSFECSTFIYALILSIMAEKPCESLCLSPVLITDCFFMDLV